MTSPETITTLSPAELQTEHDTLLKMVYEKPLSPEDRQAAQELLEENRAQSQSALSREGTRHALKLSMGTTPLDIESPRTEPVSGFYGNEADNWRNTRAN